VAASLQNSRLDEKTIGWGATGKSAWGQNRLCGAPRLRRDKVELDKRHIIHPQAILQPERAANLRPETILVMAQAIVTLHNDMLSAPMKGGFALLDGKVSTALIDNLALFDFCEMARISPWINKQGVLVLDFVFDIGFKNARCVRNGRKGGKAAQIQAREGALASGAPPDASGQPTNKAAVDWLLMGAEEGTRDMTWEQIEKGADKLRAKGGKAAQIVARAGALVSGAPCDASGQPTNKAAVDWLLMGAVVGTRDMTWEQIEEGTDKLRPEGGKAAQILARAGALVSGAPCDASGQPTNKAAMDWSIMSAEVGTRNMTWDQIEEGADKLRGEGGRKGGTAAQIVTQAGALVSGAPPDACGQPTNKAAVDWSIMGAEEGTRDTTWEQIEEGAARLRGEGGATCKTAASRKRKSEGGMRTGIATKATFLALRQDACVHRAQVWNVLQP